MLKANPKFTSTLMTGFVPKKVKELDAAALEIVTDIDRGASVLAPKKTRNLVNSKKITRIAAGHYRVTFGSALVRYARRRHFENKLHPNTLLYLKRAGDSIARGDIRKYLR